ncbi:DUF4822 domain-containing protein [Ralstonia sp. 24A2]|uniref:DUF4822 domain-containing protein n=1 Tax=Ralstonia sp. 24A2 TaxID=3447364 RepID=UPI003F6A13BC
MKIKSIIMTTALAAGMFLAGAAQAETPAIHPEALGKTVWLTTEVYVDGHPDTNVKDDYPGVVGISKWDMQTNRYEFFDTKTGESKHALGGGGYFFITGDKKHHVLVSDKGTGGIARKLEKLDDSEFTYTRVVPEKMTAGNPPVKIWVVHKPYRGQLNIQWTDTVVRSLTP